MANGAPKRFWNFLIAQDIAANALLGGAARETLSGSIGRALEAHSWWAPVARDFVDTIFGKGHCVREAAREAAHRITEAQFQSNGGVI